MLSFTYDCGVLGGVLLTGWEEEPFVDLPLEMPAGLPGPPGRPERRPPPGQRHHLLRL